MRLRRIGAAAGNSELLIWLCNWMWGIPENHSAGYPTFNVAVHGVLVDLSACRIIYTRSVHHFGEESASVFRALNVEFSDPVVTTRHSPVCRQTRLEGQKVLACALGRRASRQEFWTLLHQDVFEPTGQAGPAVSDFDPSLFVCAQRSQLILIDVDGSVESHPTMLQRHQIVNSPSSTVLSTQKISPLRTVANCAFPPVEPLST